MITANNLTLDDFLKHFKVKKCPNSSGEYTHTKLSGGKYLIPENRIEELFQLYNKHVFENDIESTLTEANSLVTPIKIDIDFRYTNSNNEIKRIYKKEDIDAICKLYMKHISQWLNLPTNEHHLCIILEKSCPMFDSKNKTHNDLKIIKDGIHIMFPKIITHAKIQHKIREGVLSEISLILDKYNFINSYKEIVDESVIERNNWFLYGSTKTNMPAYRVTYLYEIKDNIIKSLDIKTYSSLQYVKLMSILFKEHTLWRMLIRKEKEGILDVDSLMIKSDYIKHKEASRKKGKFVSKKDSSELDFIKKLVDILDPLRSTEYKSWIELGWCLHNIHNSDNELLDKWIEFSKKDPRFINECAEKCKNEWNAMRGEGLDIGTLRMWARIDNKIEYEKLIEDNILQFIAQKIQQNKLNQYDIAKIVHKLYKHEYKTINVNRSKYVWYSFINHRWQELDCHSQMRNNLSEKVSQLFYTLGMNFLAKYKEDVESGETYRELSHRTLNIAEKLKTTSYKNSIVTECQDVFYQDAKEFLKKLNSNNKLLGCDNGVYDLERLEFRDGRPDDYISISTKLEYDDNYSMDHPIIQEIQTFISQVLPDKSIREYVMKVFGSFLDGSTGNEKFYVFSGSGGNGKSKLLELLEGAMGDYCCTLPITLLTKKRGDSNAASPELAITQGKRFAKLQEPDEQTKLNVGLMKELTGGDTIQCRALYSAPIEFKPQFKLILVCNDKPTLPPHDEGTWRRVRLIEFPSKFTENPSSDPNKLEFPIDLELSSKIQLWKDGFLWLLLEYYKKYLKDGITEPEKVIEYTQIYRRENDIFLEFINEVVVQEMSGVLALGELYKEYKLWFKENYQSTGVKIKRKEELRAYCVKKYGKEYNPVECMHKTINNIPRGICWLGYKLVPKYSNETSMFGANFGSFGKDDDYDHNIEKS